MSARDQLRQAAKAALSRVAESTVARGALASYVAAMDAAERVDTIYDALWSLSQAEREALGRRLASSSHQVAHDAGASASHLDEARRHLLQTGGACAGSLADVVTAGLRGAGTDAIEDAWAALGRQAAEDPHTLEYGVTHASIWAATLPRFGARLEGARVLELGPGYTLAGGLTLHALGAARYVGADLFPVLSRRSETYRRLRERIAGRPPFQDPAATARALARFDAAVDLSGPELRLRGDAVLHDHPVDAAKLPYSDGAFDVVLSKDSYEHFRDPANAARECRRVLAPGGLALHRIDMRDHRDFGRPHDFLRFEDDAWSRRFDALPFDYTNRMRRGELAAIFEAAGHEVLAVDAITRHPVDDALRAELHPRFRALDADELGTVVALFVLRAR